MNQEERKEAVLAWIQSGCNYDEGVKLYTQFGKNNFLRKDFLRKEKKYATKIIYELCKSAGLNYLQLKSEDNIPVIQEKVAEPKTIQKPEIFVVHSDKTPPENELPEIMEAKDLIEYPAAMRRIIAEYAEFFQERSKMHRILTEMPEGNNQALKTKRAEIFDIIKSLSVRLEFLYTIRQQFDLKGEIPSDDEIWPTPKEELETELPDDPEQLRKMKKNQQSANSKDQNMLDYQSKKKAEELCPMPAGPKRMKLENRIKARVKFIQEIDLKLVKTDAV